LWRIGNGTKVELKPELGRFESTFSEEVEAQLVSRVKELGSLLYFSGKEFLKLA
jgi:hypothetical protein